jgi:LysR family glycine cleavage system transcriptional activator
MSRPIRGFGALPSFAAAARGESFTAAAEELGVTQAAISHQIRELEEQLGVELFRRASRGVTLTPPGEILCKAVEIAFDGINGAIDRMKSTKPRLRVTVAPSFAAKWLVPRLHRFLGQMPEVEVFIDIQLRLTELSQQDTHIAIMFGSGDFPAYRVDRLYKESIFPVCSPALIKGPKRLKDPRDLRKYTLLDVDWHSQGVSWPNWRTWFEAAGLSDVNPGRTVRFVHSALAIQAAIEGQGIALCESTLVADDLAAGRLVQPFALSLKGPPQFFYCMVSRKKAAPNSIEARFREWLIQETSGSQKAMKGKARGAAPGSGAR